MRICLKKPLKIGGVKTLERHREGLVVAVRWDAEHNQDYLVDFSKDGVHYISSKDCDVLNC